MTWTPPAATMTTDSRLIRLAEADNVLMLATSVPAGERLSMDGDEVTLAAALTLGHKIAARDIAEGEVILKYDFPIGVATTAIPKGGHVHVHNVRSSYTASYVVEAP